MKTVSAFVLVAAFATAPFAAGEDKKLERPPLDAKEWKKQKSGLEIWDVKEGKGEAVKPGATVVIHYTGWLTDEKATKFDSSLDRDMKAEFSLDMLIKGWQEGIPGMKPGGVRRLKIPADLAYGEKGRKGIPGNATLVFEIELFEAK
jgi:FKBP-type peptidyl-prolyl cis-trans isomerase